MITTSNGTNQQEGLLIQYTETNTIFLLRYSCQNCLTQNLIRRKYQTNQNWGTFYKITGQHSSKVSGMEGQGRQETSEIIGDQGDGAT